VTALAPPQALRRRGARARSAFRPDIQALRAVAIAAVVVNHLWPTRLPGGYVGVDVFFVISGYLISSHLFRELRESGRVRLGAFYARRIRRLLPAAFLVLAVSAVLVWAFLPFPRWPRNAWEITASAGYFENWALAALSVNYSAANDAATVVQHYWSLSVEEQFYIVWPLLVVGAALLGRRLFRSPRTPLLIAVAAVAVAGFASSAIYTQLAPNQAYFATFTRAWEFAIGGIVALALSRVRMPRVAAECLSVLGIVAIITALWTFSPETPFPGAAAALPVLGTAAVIVAGTAQPRLWHSALSGSRPVQWLGGVSYSLYLWHWPLIVVAPFALRSELTGVHRVALLVLALALAWATKVAVEDRGQRWSYWRQSVGRPVGLMLVGFALVGVLAASLSFAYNLRIAAELPDAPLPSGPCDGPRALADPSACADAFGPADSAVMAAKNEYFYAPEECGPFLPLLAIGEKKTTHVCDFSEAGQEPGGEVWIVGDSHAQQWQGAVFELARERHWRVTTSYFGGCPAAQVAFTGFRGSWGPADAEDCRRWSRDVLDAVVDAAPDVVFTSMSARQQLVDDGTGRPSGEQFAEGLRANWSAWTAAGSRVVVIGDVPLNAEVRDVDCVLLNVDDPLACARPRALAQPFDPVISTARESSDLAGVVPLDLTERFCDDATCYAVVGRMPVFYDADHLNLQYVRMLAGDLAAAVDAEPRVSAGA
jgi:peptidoglycan/LPS O-acetylase OafA/YrhL